MNTGCLIPLNNQGEHKLYDLRSDRKPNLLLLSRVWKNDGSIVWRSWLWGFELLTAQVHRCLRSYTGDGKANRRAVAA